jgi:outer membrane protein TolC
MKSIGFAALLASVLIRACPAGAEALSLSQCIDKALGKSYQLQAGSEAVRAAQAAYGATRSQYYPSLSADAAHDQLFYRQYGFRQQQAELRLDWGTGDRLLGVAEPQHQQVLAREADRRQTELGVTRRVARLYVSILQKQVSRELLQRREDLLDGHLQISRAMWQAGTRTQFDVLQTRSAVSGLREQVLRSDIEADSLRQELSRLIDLPDYHALEVRELQSQAASIDSISDLEQLGLANNPLLKSLELQWRAEQLRLREVRATQLPHLQVTGGFVVDRDPTAAGNYWQLGAGIQMPLLRWGLARFQADEIRATARSLQLQESQARLELQIELDQIRERITKLREIRRLRAEQLTNAQESFQIAEANYRAGLITNLEYLTAQNDLLEVQLALQQTRLDTLLGLVDLYTLANRADKISGI